LKQTVLLLLSLLLILFSGCSTKKFYEPTTINEQEYPSHYAKQEIIDSTLDGAVLEDGQLLYSDGTLGNTIPDGYRFVGRSDGWNIAAKMNGDVLLQSVDDNSSIHELSLKKTVAAATVQGDTLAVLFASNEMAIYKISTKSMIMKELGTAPVAIDSRITNPRFLNELVLFLTLDGKIVIVNSTNKKVLRSMIVSSEENFNNIIYFNVIDDNLLAATPFRVFSLAGKEYRESYEIRNIDYSDAGLFLTTKQGEVVSLSNDLKVKAKRKFPFAHFLGLIVHNDTLYLLEKEGYIISLSLDLEHYEVYEADFDDGFIFIGKDAFYVGDRYFKVLSEQK